MKSTHLTGPTQTAKAPGAQRERGNAPSGAVTAFLGSEAVDHALDEVPVEEALQTATGTARDVSDDIARDLASKARANRRTVQVVGSAAIGFLGGLLAASA